jgi:glucose/mannose-6-phosphate isomerase
VSGLDERSVYERLDPEGLLGRIGGLPEQCREAWQRASGFGLPKGHGEVDQVVVTGMGGSGIGGDILRALAELESPMTVSVCRGYDLPAFVGERTLVIACSHSGETEETVSAFEQALERGAKVVLITKGGRLLAMAQERGVPALVYEYAGEPRSALGHQLMRLLAVGQRVGLVGDHSHNAAEAVALMEDLKRTIGERVAEERNPAKQLARRLQGRLPIVFGAGVLVQAAHRWKTQLNENSKCWGVYDELPELDHNAIAGFGLPEGIGERAYVVFLYHPTLHPRVILRYEATQEALERAGVPSERVEAKGSSPLSQVLTAILYGDYVSYYLAILNGVSPSPVEAIQHLKRKLAGEG